MSAQETVFLRREEAARRLNCHVRTIDRLVAKGQLQSVRPPGTTWRLIPQQAVNDFLYGNDRLASVHDLDERRRRV